MRLAKIHARKSNVPISGSTRRALCALLFFALPWFAAAQTSPSYPSRPVRLIVPYPPGGPLDTAARALAESVRDTLGVVVVENRAGAGGNVGVDYVAKQPPDGHTLVIGAVATHAINPWLFSRLPYDPVRDFAPITLIAHVPNVLVMLLKRQRVITSSRCAISSLMPAKIPASSTTHRAATAAADTWRASC
jgi:tripartite-type tricarboxylate transporter receptor subunit TctC